MTIILINILDDNSYFKIWSVKEKCQGELERLYIIVKHFFTGVHGIYFECECLRLIVLSVDITFDTLNKLISEKIRLSPNEDITSIVYISSSLSTSRLAPDLPRTCPCYLSKVVHRG